MWLVFCLFFVLDVVSVRYFGEILIINKSRLWSVFSYSHTNSVLMTSPLLSLCSHSPPLLCVRHPVSFVFTPVVVLPLPSQMGGASSYSTQFLSHAGPRGPPGMISSRPGPPPSTAGLYPTHPHQAQKMPQHGGYPGPQQGLKRPYHSEVSQGAEGAYTLLDFFQALVWIVQARAGP